MSHDHLTCGLRTGSNQRIPLDPFVCKELLHHGLMRFSPWLYTGACEVIHSNCMEDQTVRGICREQKKAVILCFQATNWSLCTHKKDGVKVSPYVFVSMCVRLCVCVWWGAGLGRGLSGLCQSLWNLILDDSPSQECEFPSLGASGVTPDHIPVCVFVWVRCSYLPLFQNEWPPLAHWEILCMAVVLSCLLPRCHFHHKRVASRRRAKCRERG